MGSTRVLVAGVVGLDDIITSSTEVHGVLGGSAPFAAVAAALCGGEVYLWGIVGDDFPQEYCLLMEAQGVSLVGMEVVVGKKTFRWCGCYDSNMNNRSTVWRELNVLEGWSVCVSEALRRAVCPCKDSRFVLALASATGALHQEMLAKCSSASFVIADTMDYWIVHEREETNFIVAHSDIFLLNESEAFLYAGTEDVAVAGAFLLGLGARFVIVKLGSKGAILFFMDELGTMCQEYVGVWCLEGIVDPTGAGDAYLGAIAGYVSQCDLSCITVGDIVAAMRYGAVLASFVCEGFSLDSLVAAGRSGIQARFSLFA